MKNVTLICDMQYGSTGKGLIAGYLAERDAPDTLVTAWSMNAGHTYIDADGREFIHCMLANGIVSPSVKVVLIGPGSQIGIEKLREEISKNNDILWGKVSIYIHEHACVIQDRHIEEEAGPMTKIGSTKKGCGAALIEKIRRNPDAKIVAKHFSDDIEKMSRISDIDIRVVPSWLYDRVVDNAKNIQVEGAQGFSLGINSGFYPYTTSRECTPAQIMVDCGIPISKLRVVVGCMRTYPIRVSNRYDDEGKMVGWSGPGYPDQVEIDFGQIGQKQEHTTVTKLPRRIFTFSKKQTNEAMRMVMPDEIFLNFANYCRDAKQLGHIIGTIEEASKEYGCGTVRYIGTGPTKRDVKDVLVDGFNAISNGP